MVDVKKSSPIVDNELKNKRAEIENSIEAFYYVSSKDWFSSLVRLPDSDIQGEYYRIPDSITINKVIDTGFYDNPNLVQQYTKSKPSNSDSKFLNAAVDTVMDMRREKAIDEAAEKSSACACLYIKKRDKKSCYIDIMFYNKSYVRKCKGASLLLANKKITRPTLNSWIGEKDKNDFYNLLTFKLPFEILNEDIRDKVLCLTFDDEELKEDNYGVMIDMKFNFSSLDIRALELSRIEDKDWSEDLIQNEYHNLYPFFAFKRIQDINFMNASNLRDFIENPFCFPEINEYKKYCEEYNKRSKFVDFCSSINDYSGIEEVRADLETNRLMAKKGPIVFNITFIALGIVTIFISFLFQTVGWAISFFTVNVLACYFLCRGLYEDGFAKKRFSQDKEENKSNLCFVFCALFVITHIILALVVIINGNEAADSPIIYSWALLVVGIIIAIALSRHYNPSKISDATKKFAEKIVNFEK